MFPIKFGKYQVGDKSTVTRRTVGLIMGLSRLVASETHRRMDEFIVLSDFKIVKLQIGDESIDVSHSRVIALLSFTY